MSERFFRFAEATKQEQLYAVPQEDLLAMITGAIGRLSYNFEMEFPDFQNENDHIERLKDRYFVNRQKELMKRLRTDEELGCAFQDLDHLKAFCEQHPNAKIGEGQYAFRIDYAAYAYIAIFDTNPGTYNFSAECYFRRHLIQHLLNSANGIQFTDQWLNFRFALPDGAKAVEVDEHGGRTVVTCRYTDDYHVQISTPVETKYFHVCDYYRELLREGKEVWPLDPSQVLSMQKEKEVEI